MQEEDRSQSQESEQEEVEELPVRKYCSPCERTLLRHSRSCGTCGTRFLPEAGLLYRCAACEEAFQRAAKRCEVCGCDFLPYECMACEDRSERTDMCHACHWERVHAKEAEAEESTCMLCGTRFLPRNCVVEGCGAYLMGVCPTCHEQKAHDAMRAYVWTLPECPRCSQVIQKLQAVHRRVEIRSLERLQSGEEPDVDAMAAFVLGGGVAPLVRIEGRYLDASDLKPLLEEQRA